MKKKKMEKKKEKFKSDDAINDIHRKVIKAPVLNGGFDSLMVKINNIESNNEQLKETLQSVHKAIYDPDNGIYSRITTCKNEHNESMYELNSEIENIKVWKNNIEKNDSTHYNTDIELTKKIDSHAVKLENIEKWKNGIFSITKWTAATVAGATITILFKILYDVMSK
jgi:hypothetical protein